MSQDPTRPPTYPYPDDEILWSSYYETADPSADSWTTLGVLPEPDETVYNGTEHVNPYRLVIHTPVRGSMALLTNVGDFASLLTVALVALAHDDSGMYGPTDEVAFEAVESYYETRTGVDVDFIKDRVRYRCLDHPGQCEPFSVDADADDPWGCPYCGGDAVTSVYGRYCGYCDVAFDELADHVVPVSMADRGLSFCSQGCLDDYRAEFIETEP